MDNSLSKLTRAYKSILVLHEGVLSLTRHIYSFKELNSTDEDTKKFISELIRSRQILTDQIKRLQVEIDKPEKAKKLYTIQVLKALATKSLKQSIIKPPKCVQQCYSALIEKVRRLLVCIEKIILLEWQNQSQTRPPLALGYDINTPPAAPPYAFNLVYYSLKTDLEGIYHERHERFETSRS